MKNSNTRLNQNSSGFTLVELLVVMAIIGILAVISLANFRTSQIKARDAERKANLRQITNALEAYMSDYGVYPPAQNGKIKACGCGLATPNACEWTDSTNREFCDANNTVYMKEVASDPTGAPHFCYESDGTYFKIYADLENDNDPERKSLGTHCGSNEYDFGIASGNVSL